MKLPPQPWLHAPALRGQALAGAVVAAVTLAFYWSPLLPLTVLLGAALLYLFWQRLDLGLLVVLVSAPFYRFPKLYDQGGLGALLGREGALEVSLAESALILCLLAWGLRRFFPPRHRRSGDGKVSFYRPRSLAPSRGAHCRGGGNTPLHGTPQRGAAGIPRSGGGAVALLPDARAHPPQGAGRRHVYVGAGAPRRRYRAVQPVPLSLCRCGGEHRRRGPGAGGLSLPQRAGPLPRQGYSY